MKIFDVISTKLSERFCLCAHVLSEEIRCRLVSCSIFAKNGAWKTVYRIKFFKNYLAFLVSLYMHFNMYLTGHCQVKNTCRKIYGSEICLGNIKF